MTKSEREAAMKAALAETVDPWEDASRLADMLEAALDHIEMSHGLLRRLLAGELQHQWGELHKDAEAEIRAFIEE
jgi:hypothetical protein